MHWAAKPWNVVHTFVAVDLEAHTSSTGNFDRLWFGNFTNLADSPHKLKICWKEWHIYVCVHVSSFCAPASCKHTKPSPALRSASVDGRGSLRWPQTLNKLARWDKPSTTLCQRWWPGEIELRVCAGRKLSEQIGTMRQAQHDALPALVARGNWIESLRWPQTLRTNWHDETSPALRSASVGGRGKMNWESALAANSQFIWEEGSSLTLQTVPHPSDHGIILTYQAQRWHYDKFI